MRRQFECYFELLPILAIVLILIANEHRQAAHQLVEFERNAPAIDVQMPRLIFR